MISNAAALNGLESLLASLAEPSTDVAPEEVTGEVIASDDTPVVDNAEQVAGDVVETQPEVTPPKRARGKRTPAVAADKPAKAKGKGSSKKAKPAPVETQGSENLAATEPTSEKDHTDNVVSPDPVVEAAPTPKPAPVKKVFFGRDKIKRLEHKLGNEVGKYFLLSQDDLALEGDALTAKIAENKATFKKLAVKVQNRATGIIELVSNRSQRLNPVVGIALRLLSKDGMLVTGDDGNLHQRLLAVPYTKDAARAMGNSTLGALRALGIVVPSAVKQEFVPNDDSVFLALVSEKLGLNFVDVEASIAEEDAAEALKLAALKAKVIPVPETPDVPELVDNDAGAEPQIDAAPQGDDAVAALIDGIVGAANEQQLDELEAGAALF